MSINNLIGYYSGNLQYNICNNNHLKFDSYESGQYPSYNFLKLYSNSILSLNISNNIQIKYLPKLTNLKTLICNNCPYLSENSLNQLIILEYLNISGNRQLVNLSNLMNLKILICRDCLNLFNGSLKRMLNLEYLDISDNDRIRSLLDLKNLKTLICINCPYLKNEFLTQLTK